MPLGEMHTGMTTTDCRPSCQLVGALPKHGYHGGVVDEAALAEALRDGRRTLVAVDTLTYGLHHGEVANVNAGLITLHMR